MFAIMKAQGTKLVAIAWPVALGGFVDENEALYFEVTHPEVLEEFEKFQDDDALRDFRRNAAALEAHDWKVYREYVYG